MVFFLKTGLLLDFKVLAIKIMTKKFKKCEVCTIYLDQIPIYDTIPYINKKGDEVKKKILKSIVPAIFKSSLINPNRDDACVDYKGKLLKISE